MNQSNDPQQIEYGVPPTQLPTSTLAMVSMIAGLLGFGVFPVIGTIIAIITGYMARKETRAVPPKFAGDGMATAGIIMGYIQVGLIVISICCFIAYFVFIFVAVGTGN
ncbi:MAG: DUF4190 domain-containing protein [Anaerolineales bacterium]|nr:DUF4190 domain-containing protein [Anaerolineales bacterium]